MIELSDPQREGLKQIVELVEWMNEELKIPYDMCWFLQKSLNRVTWHTLQALCTKGFLIERDYRGGKNVVEYYKIRYGTDKICEFLEGKKELE